MNPTITRRYFRVEADPIIQALKKIGDQNREAIKEIDAFCQKIGAKTAMCRSGEGKVLGFSFEGQPDQDVFRRSKVTREMWVPRGNTKAGKEMAAAMKAIPELDSVYQVMPMMGLPDRLGAPIFFGPGKFYCANIFGSFKDDLWFISVPWAEVDPSEIKAVREGKPGSEMLNFLANWAPCEGLVEVKEWEADKAMKDL